MAARNLLWDWTMRTLFELGILQQFDTPLPEGPPFLWDVARILIGAGLIVAGFMNQQILRFIF
ncbi:MAG: hypothetical protein JW910_11310 [Anaerolineae bacterium]|nr:hypothetical protein [Anaerolineae bacterium]